MKNRFQAKEIQERVGISSRRYEYLAVKIPIYPAEPGTGRGKTHLYDFRGLMEFAVAHQLGRLGLPPAKIRKALMTLTASDRPGPGNRPGIYAFDPDRPTTNRVCFVFKTTEEGTEIDYTRFADEITKEDEDECDILIYLNLPAIKARVLNYTGR